MPPSLGSLSHMWGFSSAWLLLLMMLLLLLRSVVCICVYECCKGFDKVIGGLACTWGCFGVGSRTCLEALNIWFGCLSVRFLFWKSLDSLLSFRLFPIFLTSSSASLDCSFHFFISSSRTAPLCCIRYSVISVLFSLGSPVPL